MSIYSIVYRSSRAASFITNIIYICNAHTSRLESVRGEKREHELKFSASASAINKTATCAFEYVYSMFNCIWNVINKHTTVSLNQYLFLERLQ
jgi:hypothetical protein